MNNHVLLSFVNILLGIVSPSSAALSDARLILTHENSPVHKSITSRLQGKSNFCQLIDLTVAYACVQCFRRNREMFISLEFVSSKCTLVIRLFSYLRETSRSI